MIKHIAETGRLISLVIMICIYTSMWGITTTWIKGNNDDSLVKVLSILWIALNCLALLGFLMWSWTY